MSKYSLHTSNLCNKTLIKVIDSKFLFNAKIQEKTYLTFKYRIKTNTFMIRMKEVNNKITSLCDIFKPLK